MAEPSSPWDDAPIEESLPPPKRKWRPWWQWNILTLFGVLFVFAWFRYLVDMGPGQTWALALLLLAIWGLAPIFFFENFLTSVPAQAMPSNKSFYDRVYTYERRRGRMNLLLSVLSVFGLVLLCLAIIHFVVQLGFLMYMWIESGGQIGYGYRRGVDWMTLSLLLVPPLFEIVTCATLVVLCEIAFRLDRPFQESASAMGEQENNESASSQPRMSAESSAEVHKPSAD